MTEIHPRVHGRHPEIEDGDVIWAWENYVDRTDREVTERELRIGFDGKGRELEMVGALSKGNWLVYHAMTSPTKKTRAEIEKARRNLR